MEGGRGSGDGIWIGTLVWEEGGMRVEEAAARVATSPRGEPGGERGKDEDEDVPCGGSAAQITATATFRRLRSGRAGATSLFGGCDLCGLEIWGDTPCNFAPTTRISNVCSVDGGHKGLLRQELLGCVD